MIFHYFFFLPFTGINSGEEAVLRSFNVPVLPASGFFCGVVDVLLIAWRRREGVAGCSIFMIYVFEILVLLVCYLFSSQAVEISAGPRPVAGPESESARGQTRTWSPSSSSGRPNQ